MKILIAHNAYQQRGGEDVVVDAEIALLREHGHQVSTYRRHNDELLEAPRSAAATSAIWSRRTASDLEQLFGSDRPDLIHVHNTFPLISPSLYWAASRQGIPVVQTLHNFRMLCPQAMFLREGKVCEDCMGKIPWRAVTRKCYRSSAAQSAVLSGMLIAHDTLGTFRQKVTRYIVLNEFCRSKFIKGGLPADRMRVKPHFVASSSQPDWSERRGGLFVGRLSPEKGIEVLVQALTQLPRSLRVLVAGSGPLQAGVKNFFGDDYLGFCPPAVVQREMARALYVVAPSTCYETFGMSVVEAFAAGTAVIASNHGSLGELVRDGETGLLVEPGNAVQLAERMRWAEAHPDEMKRMGMAARAEYERRFTPERNYRMLMDIYDEAIAAERETRNAA